MLWLMAIVVWYVIGILGFIFWWARESNLYHLDILLTVFVGGTLGPFTWLVGATIHHPASDNHKKILVKRRKQ